MNREQQIRRKERDRKKTYDGIVSSLSNDGPLPRETIIKILRESDELGLRTITHIAHMALDKERAVRDRLEAVKTAEHCQCEMSDMQAKIADLTRQLEGGTVARLRKMSKKARAYRPEKRGSSQSPFHPMSGRKNRNRHHAR